MHEIGSQEEVAKLRESLASSAEKARSALRSLVDDPDLLLRLKFERLGCDPFNVDHAENICEQVDQWATHQVALDALEDLMERHPGKKWRLAPGATGSGHDIQSVDDEVAAEVFAAVRPDNNQKLRKDTEKVAKFRGQFKYVYFRSPAARATRTVEGGVTVASLGLRSRITP